MQKERDLPPTIKEGIEQALAGGEWKRAARWLVMRHKTDKQFREIAYDHNHKHRGRGPQVSEEEVRSAVTNLERILGYLGWGEHLTSEGILNHPKFVRDLLILGKSFTMREILTLSMEEIHRKVPQFRGEALEDIRAALEDVELPPIE